MATTEAKKTALFDQHHALGAKMVAFAGYSMPLQYAGQIEEHRAVRDGVGLFDLSHMGEFRLRGDGALAAVDRLVTNSVVGTEVGQAVYSPMCLDNGGIVDDLIVYNLDENSVLLVVNAANIEKDKTWIQEHLPTGVSLADESDTTSLIAVQGPGAESFLAGLTTLNLSAMGTYTALPGDVAGVTAVVSRTGYTGEDGFELYVDNAKAGELWGRLMEAGGSVGIQPIGLAARDTLRFEMGYCLYGNDIDESTSPLQAGLGWTVKLNKESFVGREALMAEKKAGIPRRLVGLEPEAARRIPRPGYPITHEGGKVGHVTSGTFSPSLDRGLAMGYVESELAGPGSRLGIDVRGTVVPVSVCKLPFYTQGSR